MVALLSTDLDSITAVSAITACLNNLGPGLGEVASHYANINDTSKWILVLAMLFGRLEVFTLLVLFTLVFGDTKMVYQTLMVYSSTDGHTAHICLYIANEVTTNQHQVTCVSLDEVTPQMMEDAQQIVIGASIRYGHFQKQMYSFIETYQALLEIKDNAFFGVNLVARKSDKNLPTTNPYMIKALEKLDWVPKHVDVFAGRLDYPSYGVFDKAMIRFIMWMTGGPTDVSQSYDFTCWKRVDSFADHLKS